MTCNGVRAPYSANCWGALRHAGPDATTPIAWKWGQVGTHLIYATMASQTYNVRLYAPTVQPPFSAAARRPGLLPSAGSRTETLLVTVARQRHVAGRQGAPRSRAAHIACIMPACWIA